MARKPSPRTRNVDDRRLLIGWAADCAERVLPLFDVAAPDDERPRAALDAARAWQRGEIPIGLARQRAADAHAAAREVTDVVATAAARAAGHAAAVAHMGGHARGAADFALQAIRLANPDDPTAEEREDHRQRRALPDGFTAFVYERPGVATG